MRPAISRFSAALPCAIALLAGAALGAAHAPPAATASVATTRSAAASPLRVEGTVADRDGRPVVGASVQLTLRRWDPNGSSSTGYRGGSSDARGRFVIDDATDGIPLDALWTASAMAAHGGEHGPSVDVLAALQRAATTGEPARIDLVTSVATATITGRLTIRPGDGEQDPTPFVEERPGRPAPSVVIAGERPYDQRTATVDADGRFSLRVPPGTYRLSATTPGALATVWPDLEDVPIGSGEALRVGDHGTAVADFSMRARLPYDATTEAGTWEPGWRVQDAERRPTDPARCYPPDPHVSRVVGAGSRAVATFLGTGEAVSLTRPSVVRAGNLLTLTVENAGDRRLWLDDAHLEGPGAQRFRKPASWSQMPCARNMSLPPKEPYGGGTAIWFDARSIPSAPERLDIVIPHDQGELRVPLEVRDLPPEPQPTFPWPTPVASGPRPSSPTTAKRPFKGTAPTLASLELSRRAVRVHLPGAGTATVVFQRRAAHRAARWRTVRTVRLRSTGAADLSRGMPRLRPARYRVRLTASVAGQVPRTITVLHRIR
ncbi:carboxypeptidase-like regulatory domain-containing protein [Patulibacter brassicae]|uniref:Carboxypeptidase-like regulatory domain-containing protein n=1 Tax=Patulibacter brassicae TaxID=1705717 RepID=A0ABU4VIB8_9ACTN|nr:carboxypeptidase-like regulatory domain-containing protein [Patulibacter brassicae]MDX8151586.1 carboxypeptidase-like regulatory domain-containing protein [Patulibacter brassicae]